jgi:ClpP class serine protease
MANWSSILNDIETYQDQIGELNHLRKVYLDKIASITERNVIAYYSGWLVKPDLPNIHVNDLDINAFMNAIYGLDKSKGLDLILHTPGGDIAATEALVEYIHDVFKGDVRAIVPQLSMSCGTMIALSCKEIIMGKQSSLGPIDPQMGGLACQSIVDEIDRIEQDVIKNPLLINVWQPILNKYHPTFVQECENAIKWSLALATKWVTRVNPQINMTNIESQFITHSNNYSHNRHISKDNCKQAGLNVSDLESNAALQDAVLSLHHCYMILFDKWRYSKIVENNIGNIYLHQYSNK